MPRISVVVPIYNVERYVTDCLESLAQQTEPSLEVLMVDDGSTDSSPAIASAFAERDARFRLVSQPNGGLGNARNTGADLATGEYLAFVDSDDLVPKGAYELLSTSLDETGSDFATGNYQRVTVSGVRQAGMVASAFNATRKRTHISKHPALLTDRTAWNKLWRRSFWTRYGFRWPEGVLYEDIAVTLRAHVLADSVDVIRNPVYLWRVRVGDNRSITQRRTELRALRDRHGAVDGISRFLAEQGQNRLKARYDRSCAEQDLYYFLQVLDNGDDEFRSLFLELANDFFDQADPGVFDHLPAIDRLKWHFVRRRLMPELLEVLRFDKSNEIARTPIVRKGRRIWGDYPFRNDASLAVPERIYRLGPDEIPLRGRIEDVWWEGNVLRVTGFAYIAFLDLSKSGSARIRLTLEEAGHPESVVALSVQHVKRPDVTESAADGVTCYDWSGFDASLDVDSLRHGGRLRDGQWGLRVDVRSQGITRRRWLTAAVSGRARRPSILAVDGSRLIPTTESGDFRLEVSTTAAVVDTVRTDGAVFELSGMLHGRVFDPSTAQVRVSRQDGLSSLHFPIAPDGPARPEGRPFVTRVAARQLLDDAEKTEALAEAEDRGDGAVWDLFVLPDDQSGRSRVVASPDLEEFRLSVGDQELVLRPSRTGRLQLLVRRYRPEVDTVRWTEAGSLELEGDYLEPSRFVSELVVSHADRDIEHRAPMTRLGDRFLARIQPTAMPSLAGETSLASGRWHLFARSGQAKDDLVRVKVQRALFAQLPTRRTQDGREVSVVDVAYDNLALKLKPDLPMSETGPGGRRRLRTKDFPAFLRGSRTDQVLFDGYGQGSCGDDVRALYEELASRDTGLRILWSVEDGQAVAPPGAHPVGRHSRAWYEALASSRYVVAADLIGVHDLPRSPGQTILQTWHGSPVAAVGLDNHQLVARLGRGWQSHLRAEADRWDLLLSTGHESATTLRRAFDYGGTVLDGGLPRHDLLVAGNHEDVVARTRKRLGIADDRKVVLYAPTYRPDEMITPDRYTHELALDLDVAEAAWGDDYTLLLRRHPKVLDEIPQANGDFALDVSLYPDARELLLVADVLVTDYSSLMVDFAHTGRPMIFHTHDWEYYSSHLRSLYLEGDRFPGPRVTSTVDLLDAVRDATRLREEYDDVYRAFRAEFCPPGDGQAAARTVDALLITDPTT